MRTYLIFATDVVAVIGLALMWALIGFLVATNIGFMPQIDKITVICIALWISGYLYFFALREWRSAGVGFVKQLLIHVACASGVAGFAWIASCFGNMIAAGDGVLRLLSLTINNVLIIFDGFLIGLYVSARHAQILKYGS